jgi:hypothetical protein
VELADLSLARRYGAAVNVVDFTPGLSVAQRAELLFLAVFLHQQASRCPTCGGRGERRRVIAPWRSSFEHKG